MPRFKDENDFPDVFVRTIDRPSFSSEAVWSPPVMKSGSMLVNDLEARSDREFDNRVSFKADTVQSPKPDGAETDESFVNIARPDDGRRQFIRSSNRWPSTLWGTAARTTLKGRSVPVFVNPEMVIPCIERKVRREAMFAKRKAGGAGSKRRKRRSYWSTIGC